MPTSATMSASSGWRRRRRTRCARRRRPPRSNSAYLSKSARPATTASKPRSNISSRKEHLLLINELPRYEILDEHSMQELERGWRRIVSELGVDFGTSEPHEPTVA